MKDKPIWQKVFNLLVYANERDLIAIIGYSQSLLKAMENEDTKDTTEA